MIGHHWFRYRIITTLCLHISQVFSALQRRTPILYLQSTRQASGSGPHIDNLIYTA